jgi:hypothetical protein
MERLSRQGFCDKSGVGTIPPENEQTGIVIIHRESPVVLGPLHFTDVFPFQHAATRDVFSVGKSATAEVVRFASIDENDGFVIGHHVLQSGRLDLRYATECSPDWYAQLIAANVAIAGGDQLISEPLALPSKGTVTIENKRSRFVSIEQSTDLRNIGNVGRHRHSGFRGDIDGAGDVTDRELSKGPRVENDGAPVHKNALELLCGNLSGPLPGFADGRLDNVPGRLCGYAGCRTEQYECPQNRQVVHRCPLPCIPIACQYCALPTLDVTEV